MNRYLTSSSAVLAAAFSFGLVACGDDDPATDTTDTSTDTNVTPDTTDTNTNPDTDATTEPDTTGDTTVADPCNPNPCTTAPAATCDGTTKKVTYAAPGTCTANGASASCAYAPTTTDCGQGEVCAAGACVTAGDVCDYVFVDRVSYVTHIAVGNQGAGTPPPDACCFDFTGDDKVDNKLGSVLKAASGLLGLDINATIAEQITSGSLTLLLETKGVDDVANDSSVAIAGFYGTSVDANAAAGTGHFTVNPSSFQAGTDLPLISFPSAKITTSVLTAGPNLFQLSLPIVGAQLDIAVTNTQLEGTVAAGPNGKGLTMDGNGGLGAKLGGVVKKKDLYDALNGYLSTCTCVTGGNLITETGSCNSSLNTSSCGANDGAACKQLPQYCPALIGLLTADVDLNEDGDKNDLEDGISIGVWVKATSGTIDGVDQCEAQ